MLSFARYLSWVVLACVLVTSGSACSWVTEKELAELRAQVEQERSELRPIADPYRIPDVDVAVEADKSPLYSLLKQFNALSSSDRTIQIKSFDRTGDLKRHRAFRCPWGGYAGWFLDLAGNDAFVGWLSLGKFSYDWDATKGLTFEIPAKAYAGAAAYGAINDCILETPIAFAIVLGYAQHTFIGHTVPLVKPNGAEFEFRVTKPRHLWIWVAGDVSHIGFVIFPIREDPILDLTSLEIKNIVGDEGELKIDPLKKCRDYKLDVTVTDAYILKSGLGVGGMAKIKWEPAKTCEE